MSRKQDTLWTAFGRQRSPPSKCQKVQRPEAVDTSMPQKKQRRDSWCDNVDAGTFTNAEFETIVSVEEASACDAAILMDMDSGEESEAATVVSPESLERNTQERPRDALKLNERKEIKDSVHGLMTFEPICMRIIDTLQVLTCASS